MTDVAPSPSEDRRDLLLARRVPVDEIVIGRAYVIHARRGGVGVAVREDGQLGYRLHREKWGEHYLFVEVDWSAGPPFGTAIPLRVLDEVPPKGERRLLAWLAECEVECKVEIRAAWEVVLGQLPVISTTASGARERAGKARAAPKARARRANRPGSTGA